MILSKSRYTREMVQSHPTWTFIFGDNMVRRGMKGQAEACRGEPNAVGVPTKWAPSMKESAFFTDDDFDKVIPAIAEAFDKLDKLVASGETVVWPVDGIGTGLAQMPTRAPKVFAYLIERRYQMIGQLK